MDIFSETPQFIYSVDMYFKYFYRMLAAHWEGNPNAVYFKAKGTGGANEMIAELEDSEVMYGLGKTFQSLYIIMPVGN